jgi:hypothetical protein
VRTSAQPATPLSLASHEAAMLDSVARVVRALGREYGEAVWPGFRPDTIPVAFVVPSRGTMLSSWRGELPAGFAPVAGVAEGGWRAEPALDAASTATTIGGRRIAQVVVAGEDPLSRTPAPGELAALAFHEAFHVFQGAMRRDGRRFGQGENAFYVASYPVFDVDNEALFALEGRLLARALPAPGPESRRALAREFLTVRRRRHARLASELALFDHASEMNEGLAQYAQLRALELVARAGPRGWRDGTSRRLAAERARLPQLAADTTRSFRLRYYSTGAAIARLLDTIAGAGWKRRLMDGNETLAGALAHAVGADPGAAASGRGPVRVTEDDLRRAGASVAALRARRLRQVDSVLARPGLRVVVAFDTLRRDVDLCGFDPQNHLQVTPTVQLQTRWWRPCAGTSVTADLGVPSVHDREARTVTAVVGSEADVTFTANGSRLDVRDGVAHRDVARLRVTAPRVTIDVARAAVTRAGDTVTVRALPE